MKQTTWRRPTEEEIYFAVVNAALAGVRMFATAPADQRAERHTEMSEALEALEDLVEHRTVRLDTLSRLQLDPPDEPVKRRRRRKT